MRLVIFFWLGLLAMPVLRAEPPRGVTFSSQPAFAVPSGEDLHRWLDEALEREVWSFRSKEGFDAFVDLQVPEAERKAVRQLLLPLAKRTWQDGGQRKRSETKEEFFLPVTPELKAKLSPLVLERFQQMQLVNHNLDAFEFATEEARTKFLGDSAKRFPATAFVRTYGGNFAIVLTPELKEVMQGATRKHFLQTFAQLNSRATEAVSVRIDDSADLKQVAEYFALGRDTSALLAFLTNVRKTVTPMEFELDTFLPENVTPLLHTYAASDGPNCVGWAACHWREALDGRVEYIDPTEFENALKARPDLLINRPKKPGDVLVLQTRAEGVYHVALYLGESPDGKTWYVGTKDGPRRMEPYRIIATTNAELIPRGARMRVANGCPELFRLLDRAAGEVSPGT